MNKIKDILHEKRKTTEDHIRQLQQVGKQGIRYTAMMPDIPFLGKTRYPLHRHDARYPLSGIRAAE